MKEHQGGPDRESCPDLPWDEALRLYVRNIVASMNEENEKMVMSTDDPARRNPLRGLVPLCAVLLTALGGCGGVTRNPLPKDLVGMACPAGIPDVRDWAGRPSALFQRDLVASIRQVQKHRPEGLLDKDGYANILAISGGGPNGAFGAGMLAGWTEHGTRPEFKLVTGVSTGALIAPLAFLGPDYDEALKRFYTTTRTEHIIEERWLLSALAVDDSLADSSPLARLIERTITEELLDKIATEHRRGRRLFILTTNLDARQAVVWNMGAIAASGKPGAVALFRQVMRASASIPVAMGPVYMPVEAGGKMYDEMHVDGGVTAEVFFYGFMLDLPAAFREVGITREPNIRIYIVRNSQISARYEQIEPSLMAIASRAIDSLINTQAVGDLYRIYTITQRDGIDFNLAYVPVDFVPSGKEMFDPVEMKRLYNLGYSLTVKGYKWDKVPVGMKGSSFRPNTTE